MGKRVGVQFLIKRALAKKRGGKEKGWGLLPTSLPGENL